MSETRIELIVSFLGILGLVLSYANKTEDISVLPNSTNINNDFYGDFPTSTPKTANIFRLPPESSEYLNFNRLSLTTEPEMHHNDLHVAIRYITNTSSASVLLKLPIFNDNSMPFNDFKDELIFIIHGYMSNGHVPWMYDLAQAFILRTKASVFLVDWEAGANSWNYQTAISNSRIVASAVGRFIKHLSVYKGVNSSRIHIIGHSLGAHIAGFIGKIVPGINRITGLDPSQPMYNIQGDFKLHKNDAKYVDVVHTNGNPMGFGLDESLGDIDFYINGGQAQPGCPNFVNHSSYFYSPIHSGNFKIDEFLAMFSCSHLRSIEYFIEAVKYPNCLFLGFRENEPAQTVTFQPQVLFSGQTVNNIRETAAMGLNPFESPCRGKFTILTNPKAPYCPTAVQNK